MLVVTAYQHVKRAGIAQAGAFKQFTVAGSWHVQSLRTTRALPSRTRPLPVARSDISTAPGRRYCTRRPPPEQRALGGPSGRSISRTSCREPFRVSAG